MIRDPCPPLWASRDTSLRAFGVPTTICRAIVTLRQGRYQQAISERDRAGSGGAFCLRHGKKSDGGTASTAVLLRFWFRSRAVCTTWRPQTVRAHCGGIGRRGERFRNVNCCPVHPLSLVLVESHGYP